MLVLVVHAGNATAAPLQRCPQSVSDAIDNANDEQIQQVARTLQNLPKECLVVGLVEALRNGPEWRAIVAVNELKLQDARLLEAMIEILIIWPPDSGFHDLVDALTLQARAGGKAADRLATLLESTARREQGTPRETAASVLGAAGRSAYPYLQRLLRVANVDAQGDILKERVREAAQAAVDELIKNAIAKGDRLLLTAR